MSYRAGLVAHRLVQPPHTMDASNLLNSFDAAASECDIHPISSAKPDSLPVEEDGLTKTNILFRHCEHMCIMLLLSSCCYSAQMIHKNYSQCTKDLDGVVLPNPKLRATSQCIPGNIPLKECNKKNDHTMQE